MAAVASCGTWQAAQGLGESNAGDVETGMVRGFNTHDATFRQT